MESIGSPPRYSWLYLAIVAICAVAVRFIPESNAVSLEVEVENRGKATIDMLLEMSKIAGTLNSAMFAAAAALTIKGKDWSTQWGRVESFAVVLALVCGAVSYLGIYYGYAAQLGMVYAGSINIHELRMVASRSMQFYGTFVGFFLIGWVFARMLEGRKTEATAP